LNAFKVLGASYAMASVIGEILNNKTKAINFNTIFKRRADLGNLTFVTATDGNHGRAVAWTANKLGCKSVVYMPHGSSMARLRAIQRFGANASIIDGDYDDTVIHASLMAEKHGWILLQDTSWPDYVRIPLLIMQGYFTLITEFCNQEKSVWPTHVLVQAGVGSLASAVLSRLFSFTDRIAPIFITVEPDGAPCLYESIRRHDGKPFKVERHLDTIMTGLACGKPSYLAWELLKAGTSAFITCPDDIARKGVRILGNPLDGDNAIISGESGAVTTGMIYEILTNTVYRDLRDKLELNESSIILLFSTEGDTDPDSYRAIMGS